jgi:mono/diheme cytochrome c family protein
MSENPNPAALDSGEPTVGSALVPVWMVVLFGGLFYWCQIYLDGHAGGFNKEVYAPFDSIAEVAAAQPKSEAGKFLAEGQAVFHQTCELCHQPNGMGKEGQFPPLAGSDWVLAPGPNRIGRIVLAGLTGPVPIKGQLFNAGATMVAWGPTYDDEHIAAVLTYIRQQWGNNARPIKPEEIKAIRAATASHAGQSWTDEELEKIPPQ